MRSARRSVGALLLAVVAAGCGKKPVEVRLTPLKGTIYGLGRPFYLKADVVDKKGDAVAGLRASFTSANPKIATVDANGVVKSVGPGKVSITAASEELKATCTLEIVDVGAIALEPPRATLAGAKGSTAQFTAILKNQKGDVVDLRPKWESSDPKVATVDAAGKVTSVGEGRATVTASLGDVSGSSDLRVVFREIATFDASPLTMILRVGEAQTVNVVAKDPAGVAIENAAALWTTSDPKVASCVNGVITGLAPGTSTIRAVCGPKSAEVSVIVN